MPQTTVETTMPIGVAGQLADLWTEQNGDIISVISEEASAEIPFGVAVRQGTADDGALLFTATSQVPLGVVVFAHHFAKPDELGDTGLKPKVVFGVLRRGRIIVFPEEAVTPASEVRIRAVAAGAEVKGAFRATADSTDCIDITPFAKWRSSADANEPAILEIDLSNVSLAVAD